MVTVGLRSLACSGEVSTQLPHLRDVLREKPSLLRGSEHSTAPSALEWPHTWPSVLRDTGRPVAGSAAVAMSGSRSRRDRRLLREVTVIVTALTLHAEVALRGSGGLGRT
jgi:hypothetical protein